jgi:MFS transporter, PAT family, beta-lactamase induction signal transducer AmpG
MSRAGGAAGGARGPAHPIMFLMLYLPFGASAGYGGVALAYLLHERGVSVAAIAAMGALNVLPNTWKVFWAPLIDTTLSARAWYLLGLAVTAAVFLVTAGAPLGSQSLPLLDVLSFALGLSSSLLAIAADRFMAYDTPEAEKGRAGGWAQAGNLGGAGLGGGLALWVAVHTGRPWTAGVLLAALSLACAIMVFRMNDPARVDAGRPFLDIVKDTGRDVLGLVLRRAGLLAIFVCLLPLGSGGAGGLWSAIAGEWGAGADEVALVGGVFSGLVSIVGAVAGGYLCDRMDRKGAYVLFGLVSATSAVAMAIGPRTPLAFLVFASLYNLILGACFAAFSGLTLEAIGQGAAGTKYNLLASVSNVPIMLMPLVDAWAQMRWGTSGMLYVEALCAAAAAAFYMAVVYATRGWRWPWLLRLAGATGDGPA